MATTANAREQAMADPAAPAGEDLARRRRLLWWKEAALSGWSPLGVFALALIPYLFLVELSTPSYHWAQPVLQGFGLLMFAWFVGIWAVRLALPRVRALRALRASARETLGELDRSLKKAGPKVSAEARERLARQAALVDRGRLERDPKALEAELKKLSELMDKTLGALRRQSWTDVALGIVLWLGVALLIRAVLIEPFRIPSGSMIPTLQIGDQIFVNKFIYGVRIPYLNRVPFVIVRPPARGDVIVFNNPVNSRLDFIKRVVGVPGDRVELTHDQVVINGVPQGRRLVDPSLQIWDKPDEGDWVEQQACAFQEDLSGHKHIELQMPQRFLPPPGGTRAAGCQGFSHEYQGPYVVPPGHVFVMGDNRDNSADSRYGLGDPTRQSQAEYVPFGNIKGKAMIIWLSWSHGGLLSNLLGSGIRTDRFFLPVR